MPILGLDYASIDGNPQPDFKAFYQEGYRFVYLRRSFFQWDSGHQAWHLAVDPVYARDAQAARDAGLVVGAYLMPTYHKTAPSAVEQVATFVKSGGTIVKGKDLPPCIDLEFPGKNGQADTQRTKADTLDFFKTIFDELKSAYGVTPAVYTSHVVWHDDNGLGGPEAPWLKDAPLWEKIGYRLRAGQGPDTHQPATPSLPLPWQRSGWWMRQFQGDSRFTFTHNVDGKDVRGQADLSDFNVFDPLAPGPDLRYDWVAARVGWNATCPTPQALSDTIKSFQHLHGLLGDGIVGPTTFAALSWQQIP